MSKKYFTTHFNRVVKFKTSISFIQRAKQTKKANHKLPMLKYCFRIQKTFSNKAFLTRTLKKGQFADLTF